MKYYYHTKWLRCRVVFYHKFNCFKLQMQKRKFFFWFDYGVTVHVQLNAFDKPLPNPMIVMENNSIRFESWRNCTMNIPMRVGMLFDEYDNI